MDGSIVKCTLDLTAENMKANTHTLGSYFVLYRYKYTLFAFIRHFPLTVKFDMTLEVKS